MLAQLLGIGDSFLLAAYPQCSTGEWESHFWASLLEAISFLRRCFRAKRPSIPSVVHFRFALRCDEALCSCDDSESWFVPRVERKTRRMCFMSFCLEIVLTSVSSPITPCMPRTWKNHSCALISCRSL
jgi:hypothetical protein